jgi:hypothetical protein
MHDAESLEQPEPSKYGDNHADQHCQRSHQRYPVRVNSLGILRETSSGAEPECHALVIGSAAIPGEAPTASGRR